MFDYCQHIHYIVVTLPLYILTPDDELIWSNRGDAMLNSPKSIEFIYVYI